MASYKCPSGEEVSYPEECPDGGAHQFWEEADQAFTDAEDAAAEAAEQDQSTGAPKSEENMTDSSEGGRELDFEEEQITSGGETPFWQQVDNVFTEAEMTADEASQTAGSKPTAKRRMRSKLSQAVANSESEAENKGLIKVDGIFGPKTEEATKRLIEAITGTQQQFDDYT